MMEETAATYIPSSSSTVDQNAIVTPSVHQDERVAFPSFNICSDDVASSAFHSHVNNEMSSLRTVQSNFITSTSSLENDGKRHLSNTNHQDLIFDSPIGDQDETMQSKGMAAVETSSAKKELSQNAKDTHRVPDGSRRLTNAQSEASSTKWKSESNCANASSTNSLWKSDEFLSSTSTTKLDSNIPARHAPFSCGWFVGAMRSLRGVFSPRLALRELRSPLFWHDVIAETVLCAYYECLIIFISVTFNSSIYRPSITHFGLYAGFFVFVCIEGWAPMCGASVNPARTWAVFLTGRMTFIKALVYTIVEIGGAAAGTMIGYGLTPSNATDQIIPLLPGAGVTAVQGMAIEAVLTFNLIFVGLVLGQPSGQPSAIASLTVGFCVGTGVMAAGTHTGGLQNPIVAFGPAIISGNFQDHWLYWVGPYVGSTVATAFYLSLKLVRETYEQKNQSGNEVNGEIQETSTTL